MALEGEFVLKKDAGTPENPSPIQPEGEAQSPSPIPSQNAESQTPSPASSLQSTQKHPLGMFTTLCEHPDGIFFQNQEEGEEVLLLVRRDFITNVPWIVMLILLALVPFAVFFFSFLFTPFIHLSLSSRALIILFYYLILFGILLVNFSIWYFNVGLVTNLRVIDLDVTGILFRDVAETTLNRIQDVDYRQVGSIPSIFNYGDVMIQTITNDQNFDLDHSPEPARIVSFLSDLLEKNKNI